MQHPAAVLLSSRQASRLPVVDHYCGTELRIRKALAIQLALAIEFGRNVMDVTLDCEDGAPVGGEIEHAKLLVTLLLEASQRASVGSPLRVGVRVHPVDAPSFASDLDIILKQAGHTLSYIMVPKVDTMEQLARIVAALDAVGMVNLPLHVLIESALGVQNAALIAAHPRIESLSFGLMDFVSSHDGAIPALAMTLDNSLGQMTHPAVVQAKLALSSACHAHGKTPAHCVVTEFNDVPALQHAARAAAQQFAYTRMWSIHPSQIKPILAAFAPNEDDIKVACAIIQAAQAAAWAPIRYDNALHDRASYRYFWQVLQKAYVSGAHLPADILQKFFQ